MRFSFFLNKTGYIIAGSVVAIFLLSFFYPDIFQLGAIVLLLLVFAVLIDSFLLYRVKRGIEVNRVVGDRFSIADNNTVSLQLTNNYGFSIQLKIIDEIPAQFQDRNWHRTAFLTAFSNEVLEYQLKPLTRGEYIFNDINVFATGPLKLLNRHYVFEQEKTVKVYPSYIQMRRYQLLAVNNKLQEAGIKRSRRFGHSMEFEQIKEYVRGDDYRTINWKATAKKEGLMSNVYTDERSQQIYCIINKGRVMKMPFNGMTLLDYAINASLVLTNVALVKQDRAGLISFAENLDSFLPADKKAIQMNKVLEALYRQQTRFLESDYEKLFSAIRNKINQRSLLILFTNFESLEGLQREMPALKRMAHYHLLLVVFFENVELKKLTETKAISLEDIYIKTIAGKFVHEKKLMVKELHLNGIPAILTSPENLTVNTINKYFELKDRLSI